MQRAVFVRRVENVKEDAQPFRPHEIVAREIRLPKTIDDDTFWNHGKKGRVPPARVQSEGLFVERRQRKLSSLD